MSAEDDIRRRGVQLTAMAQEVFVGVVAELTRSIVEGSEITGAPGQPVGQYGYVKRDGRLVAYNPGQVGGTLKSSWQTVFESPTRAVIGTKLIYAQAIEDGVGPHGSLTLRSTVGGFHSVDHTIRGAQRVVDDVTKRLAGDAT